MPRLAIELPAERVRELERRAADMGITVEHLIQASVADLLSRPSGEVERAIELVLSKHAELYRRLA